MFFRLMAKTLQTMNFSSFPSMYHILRSKLSWILNCSPSSHSLCYLLRFFLYSGFSIFVDTPLESLIFPRFSVPTFFPSPTSLIFSDTFFRNTRKMATRLSLRLSPVCLQFAQNNGNLPTSGNRTPVLSTRSFSLVTLFIVTDYTQRRV